MHKLLIHDTATSTPGAWYMAAGLFFPACMFLSICRGADTLRLITCILIPYITGDISCGDGAKVYYYNTAVPGTCTRRCSRCPSTALLPTCSRISTKFGLQRPTPQHPRRRSHEAIGFALTLTAKCSCRNLLPGGRMARSNKHRHWSCWRVACMIFTRYDTCS